MTDCSQGNSLAYASYCLLCLCLVSRGVARLACAMGYKKSTVESLLNLYPGAHIRAIRGKFQGLSGGLYDHHMLVIEVVSETDIRVIHYTGGVENREEGGASGFTSATSFSVLGVGRGGEGTGVVAEEVIKVEPEDLKCLELLQYTDDVIPFPPDKSIERARGRLNERNYGVFHNNCECFVNWAVIDKAISYQVVDGTVASVMGAVKGAKETYGNTGGSMMGAIAGGFRGLFQGYQQHREKRQ